MVPLGVTGLALTVQCLWVDADKVFCRCDQAFEAHHNRFVSATSGADRINPMIALSLHPEHSTPYLVSSLHSSDAFSLVSNLVCVVVSNFSVWFYT